MPTMVQMILRASLSGINAGWSNLSKNAPTRRPPRRPPSNPTLAPRIMRSDDPGWRTLQIPYSNTPPELEFHPERRWHAKGPRQSAARHLRGSWLVIVRTAATIGQIEISGGGPMQTVALLVVFVLTAATLQGAGFVISRVVDYQYPTLGLMTFLVLFISAFYLAWPIAVRLAEWLIRRAGYVVETEQTGQTTRRDRGPAKAQV